MKVGMFGTLMSFVVDGGGLIWLCKVGKMLLRRGGA
jgi:hypothetical protein